MQVSLDRTLVEMLFDCCSLEAERFAVMNTVD